MLVNVDRKRLSVYLQVILLALMQTSPEMRWTLWVFIIPFGLLVSAARGIFRALPYECPLPTRAPGTAIGFISIMGYSSDACIPQVAAYLRGSFPKPFAYPLFFAYVATASAVGMVASWTLGRMTRPPDAG